MNFLIFYLNKNFKIYVAFGDKQFCIYHIQYVYYYKQRSSNQKQNDIFLKAKYLVKF